jgi:hypothetical protein
MQDIGDDFGPRSSRIRKIIRHAAIPRDAPARHNSSPGVWSILC